MGRGLENAGPWLVKPGLKRLVNQALTALTWQSRPFTPVSALANAMSSEPSSSVDVPQAPMPERSGLSPTTSSE